METIKLNKCEGYLWWSNQQEPKVYQDEAIDIYLDETQNPFVVEGQLYDLDEQMSYCIKYVDGLYIINKYKVEKQDLDNHDYETIDYLSNRMDNRWLKFLRYWEAKEDENCLGMPVLTLTKNVFIGFKSKETVL